MKLIPLGEMDLTYVGPSLDFVDYGVDGQYYAMEGDWRSDRITGRLRLTNIAQKRVDNVNTPTLRGVMETPDGAALFVEMNGLSQIQEGGRVFVTSLTLRTAHADYQWVNTLFAVVEGELHGPPRPNEFRAHCRVYACEATITPISQEGDLSMRVSAYALPVLAGKEGELQSLARELKSRATEFSQYHARNGITRESAFLQRTPRGSQLLMYREFDNSSGTQLKWDGAFELWLRDGLGGSRIFRASPVASGRIQGDCRCTRCAAADRRPVGSVASGASGPSRPEHRASPGPPPLGECARRRSGRDDRTPASVPRLAPARQTVDSAVVCAVHRGLLLRERFLSTGQHSRACDRLFAGANCLFGTTKVADATVARHAELASVGPRVSTGRLPYPRCLARATGPADELRNFDWPSDVEHLINLCLVALLAASRGPGWNVLALKASVDLLYLGVAAISVPSAPGSWGFTGGTIAVAGGLAVLGATAYEWRKVLRPALEPVGTT